MGRKSQPQDIDLDQDIDFQQRSWKVQRVGWGLMVLFVLAGLSGLLGTGPLSNVTDGDEGGPLWLEYQRFGRLQAPMSSSWLAKWVDDVPLIIVEHGRPLKERMDKERIDEDDVLNAARERFGLERLDQIKYAVLERSGGISIIPERSQ